MARYLDVGELFKPHNNTVMNSLITNWLQKHRSVLYFLIFTLSVSCSVYTPQSSINVSGQPEHQDFYTSESPSHFMQLTALGNEHKTLVFEVELENLSADSMIFNPEDWQLLYTKKKNQQHIQNMEALQPLTPQDMSLMYVDLARQVESNKEAGEAIGAAIAIILIVGLLVIILKASEDDDDDEEEERGGGDNVNLNLSFVGGGESYHYDDGNYAYYDEFAGVDDPQTLEFLYKSEDMLKEEFGKKILAPGEKMTMNLYFPRYNQMKLVRLCGPTPDGEKLDLWFDHGLVRE